MGYGERCCSMAIQVFVRPCMFQSMILAKCEAQQYFSKSGRPIPTLDLGTLSREILMLVDPLFQRNYEIAAFSEEKKAAGEG